MARWWVPTLLPFLISVAACGDDGGSPQTGDEADIVGTVLRNTAKVEEDRLVFPKQVIKQDLRARIGKYAAEIKAGKSRDQVENVLLVQDRQEGAVAADGQIVQDAGNPFGFIRRAISVHDQGSKTIVMTEPATLAEVFDELQQRRMVEIGSAPQQKKPSQPKTFAPTIPLIHVSDLELYRGGGSVITLSSADIALKPTIDVGLKLHALKVDEAHVVVQTNIASELVVDASLAGPLTKSLRVPIFVGRWPLPPLGSIPLTLGLDAYVGCDVSGKGVVHASVGVHTDASIRGGVQYDKIGGTKGVADKPTFSPSKIGPTFEAQGHATLRCYLEPRIQVLLFDILGPSVTPTWFWRANIETPPPLLTLSAGIRTDLGGSLAVFGRQLGALEQPLFSVEVPVSKDEN